MVLKLGLSTGFNIIAMKCSTCPKLDSNWVSCSGDSAHAHAHYVHILIPHHFITPVASVDVSDIAFSLSMFITAL